MPTRPVASAAPLKETAAQPVVATPMPIQSHSPRWPAIAAMALLAVCLAGIMLYFVFGPKKTAVAGSRQVGDVFQDCEHCPTMVVVPAGRFMMGSAEQEMSSFDWARAQEKPVHDVHIVKPFAVGILRRNAR